MGGQACVFYGAAQISRDLDLLVPIDPENLERLRGALADLGAEPIAVPPFEAEYLRRGHSVHFRCRREDVEGLRIDLMANLRGVDDFETVWNRRNKDWPMIQRLVEETYFRGTGSVDFWLRELRSPELSIEVVAANRSVAEQSERPAVAAALTGDREVVENALDEEERGERRRDREYWQPLRQELERLRHARLILPVH
jgi:hypothetical protein